MIEIWKDIEGFGPVYQVSNFGRVRSIDHMVHSNLIGREIMRRGRIIKQGKTVRGYLQVTIKLNGVKTTFATHQLVYHSFVGKYNSKIFNIDHIDNEKTNNNLSNLQILSARQNSAKRSLQLKKTSAFTGVSWSRERRKWQSHIRVNGKSTSLGRYDSEKDAAIAYMLADYHLRNGL